MTSQITSKQITTQFAHEEIKSTFGYLSGYKGPGAIRNQIDQLQKIFPQLGGANQELIAKIENGKVMLSDIPKRYPDKEDRDLWCLPCWSKVASTYNEAVVKVFGLLNNACGDRFHYVMATGDFILETDRKAQMMSDIQAQQGADIIILELQFGLRHRGRSIRCAREFMGELEFGLGAYEIGIMLLLSYLLQLNRLNRFDDHWFNQLWVDAAGDEWRFEVTDNFVYAPFFLLTRGWLEFGVCRVDTAENQSGSASAFVAQ